VLAIALAVQKKFSDDGAGNLAALIAYYAFLSLFPLLLLAVAVLGFVLQSDPGARATILNSGLKEIPIIGTSFDLGHLKGSTVGLVVGAVGALAAGLGVTVVVQTTFNQVHGVAHRYRPNFFTARVRGLGLLAVLGVLQIVSTVVTGFVSTGTGGIGLAIAGIVAALACNLLLFFAAFRLLTSRQIETHDLWPGIIFSSIGWEILQSVGGLYVKHVLHGATQTYGSFATVIGLLAWLFLGARLVVYAAELNAVLARGYWPRSLIDPPTHADDAARRALAEMEVRSAREKIRVTFEDPTAPTAGEPPTASTVKEPPTAPAAEEQPTAPSAEEPR
jgi:YihY family inner membrane protein